MQPLASSAFPQIPWAHITQVRMTPSAVVKHFDIVGDISPCSLTGFMFQEKDPFCLQATKETSSHTVIPTTALL